jgi:hypothetical protein
MAPFNLSYQGLPTIDMQSDTISFPTRSSSRPTRSSSRRSSIASMTESIFSSDSGKTQSSVSSINTSQVVIERLVGLFLDDSLFKALCLRALDHVVRERFERNLRRLLIIFASGLRIEASSIDEQNAARFVKHRATNSAHMICNNLTRKEEPESHIQLQEEGDEADDDSDSDRSEGAIDSLVHLEVFIKSSTSLMSLKAALDVFVQNAVDKEVSQESRDIVGKAETILSNNENTEKFESSLPSSKEKTIVDESNLPASYFGPTEGLYKQHDPAIPELVATVAVTTKRVVNLPKKDKEIALTKWQSQRAQLLDMCQMVLEQSRIIRPTIQNGKTRIEWQCVSIRIPKLD